MRPVLVAPLQPFFRRWRACRIAVEPMSHVVVVELLAPKHSRECLAHDHLAVFRHLRRSSRRIEIVRFFYPRGENRLESRSEIAERRWWLDDGRRRRISRLRLWRWIAGRNAILHVRRIPIRQPELDRKA